MEKAMISMVVAMMGVLILAQVVQAMVPQKNYCCSICEECFYTYDELYSHFTSAHPAKPIDIVWE